MHNEIETLIIKEKELQDKIKGLTDLFKSFQEVEKQNLSNSIIDKLIRIQESVLSDNITLIEAYASVRYVLETLIQTELLLKESSYTFKLYYSICTHQIDKYQKFINRIHEEIKIMESYENEDKKLMDIVTDRIAKGEDSSLVMKEHDEAQKQLDDKADLEFTMFTPDYKTNGYGFTAHLLKNKILLDYKQALKDIEESNKKTAKSIVKQERISTLFDFKNQYSRVFKELKDGRSWEKKAEEANLSNEYKVIYDLSSALLHSTSYSYNTSSDYTDADKDIALKMIFKYSKKINHNINKYLDLKRYSKITVINIEEE